MTVIAEVANILYNPPMFAYVYIMSNRRRGVIYTGVTTGLAERVRTHKKGLGSKFAAKFNLTRLVYFEGFDDIAAAIAREKAVKKWRREWKFQLIEQNNPQWRDMSRDIGWEQP